MARVFIAAIIKDEHLDIREWVDHNASIGVERITLYDNNSSHGYDNELGSYLKDGYVEMVLWPTNDPFRQRAMYNDFTFMRQWRDDDWCAFIDPDEFIVLDRHARIADLIDAFSDCAGLALNWQCYGADGRVERPDMPVQQAYVTPTPDVRDHHNFKSIARLNDVAFWNNVHFFAPKNGRHVVNTRREIVVNETTPKVLDVAHIKHYITKSWVDYVRRLERGNVTRGIRKIETFFIYNPDMAPMRAELTADLDARRFKTTQSDKDIDRLNRELWNSDMFMRLQTVSHDEGLPDDAFGQICVMELIDYATLHLDRIKNKPPDEKARIAARCHTIIDQQIAFLNSIPRDTPDYRKTVVEAIMSTPFGGDAVA